MANKEKKNEKKIQVVAAEPATVTASEKKTAYVPKTPEEKAAKKERSLQNLICRQGTTGNQRIDMVCAKIVGQAFRHPESCEKDPEKKNSYLVKMANGITITAMAEPNPNSKTGQMRYSMDVGGKMTIPGAFARITYRLAEEALNPHTRGPRADRFDAAEVDEVSELLGIAL